VELGAGAAVGHLVDVHLDPGGGGGGVLAGLSHVHDLAEDEVGLAEVGDAEGDGAQAVDLVGGGDGALIPRMGDGGGVVGHEGEALAFGVLEVEGGAAVAVGLMRRMPRAWWIPGSVAVVAFGAIATYAGPVVLDPIFNRFTPLPAGRTRSEVLDLARRAGVHVGQVYVMDASRRTTAANAYVNGLGRTKRVVLYDTLEEFYLAEALEYITAWKQSTPDNPVGICGPIGPTAPSRRPRG